MIDWLRRLWTASIARQLMFGIALVHAVLMTIFVFDLVDRQRTFLVEQSTGQAESLADSLAANGTSWMLAKDFIGLEEVINSQRRFPGLRYAMFTDLNGQVLGFTDRSQVGRYIADQVSQQLLDAPPTTRILLDSPLQIDIARPVMAAGRHIGWARVGVSRAEISSNLDLVTTEGLIYTLIAIAVGVLFAFLMARGLTRDIRGLVRTTRKVRSGERDIDWKLRRADEIGALADDLHLMVDTLHKREIDLDNARRQVASSEEQLSLALHAARDGVWDWDITTGQVHYSTHWKEMLGHSEDEVGDTFEEWTTRVHPDDLPFAQQKIQAHLNGLAKHFNATFRMRHKDGHWVWVLARGALQYDADGNAQRMVGTHVDVTQRKQLEESLAQERERAQVTLESIGDGVITTDRLGHVDYMNPVAEKLTAWDQEDAEGMSLEQVFHLVNDTTGEVVANPIRECLDQGSVVELENNSILINRLGNRIPIEDSAAPIRNRSGEVIGVVLVFHDATSERHLKRRMEYQATHDHLTGLWNRRAFEERLNRLKQETLDNQVVSSLLYMDFDQFKVVNDTAGHIAGDELLKQASVLMQQQVRDSDMLARLGGDEFGVLLFGCNVERGQQIAESLRSCLVDFRFYWEDKTFQVGTSIGLTEINSESAVTNVLGLADLACFSAKEAGRNRVHVYTPDDEELLRAHGEMQSLTLLRQALEKDQLVLYSQLIVPLGEPSDTEYREVLVRLLNEDGEIIPPGKFIPAAERYGLMTDLDCVVVRKSIEWLSRPGRDRYRLSINLSGVTLGEQRLLDFLFEAFDQHPHLTGQVCFEITETAAIRNLNNALVFISKLKQLGVQFSLDDFGSGLSSFSYLKSLPIDYLKIDGSFIRNINEDRLDQAMVESIHRVSREMGIATIAEFVENDAIRQSLQKIGVQYAQGYGIEKPVPLDSLEEASASARSSPA